MLKIDYYKYASNGNNFVFIDEIMGEKIPESNKGLFSKYIGNNVSGIGCDSVIYLQKYETEIVNRIYSRKINFNYSYHSHPEFIIRIFENGLESNMCGNGLICAGHHLTLKHGIMNANIATEVPTFTPVVREILHVNKAVTKVAMGKVVAPSERFINYTVAYPLKEKQYCHLKDLPITINIAGENYCFFINNGYITFSGEPHLIFFNQNNDEDIFDTIFRSIEPTDRVIASMVDQIGLQFNQRLDYFPKGINVNFAKVLSQNTIINRCFERGINAETYACGTGAVAVAFMGNQLGLLSSDIITVLPWKARQHDLYKDAKIEVSKSSGKYSIAAQSILLSQGEYYLPSASHVKNNPLNVAA